MTTHSPAPRVVALLAAALAAAFFARPSLAAPRRGAAPPASDRPLLGRTIVLDPGHGGIDGGCSAAGYLEKDLVLAVGLQLTQHLRDAGARVGLTRNLDMELGHMTGGSDDRHRRDLATRVGVSRRLGPDLFVSLHTDASRATSAGGALVFFKPDRPDSRQAARRILSELRRLVPGPNNAALPGNLYVLRTNPYSAVLIELGFLTSPSDRALLTSPAGQGLLARAVLAGILGFFTEDPSGAHDPPAPSTPSKQAVSWVDWNWPAPVIPRPDPVLCPGHQEP